MRTTVCISLFLLLGACRNVQTTGKNMLHVEETHQYCCVGGEEVSPAPIDSIVIKPLLKRLVLTALDEGWIDPQDTINMCDTGLVEYCNTWSVIPLETKYLDDPVIRSVVSFKKYDKVFEKCLKHISDMDTVRVFNSNDLFNLGMYFYQHSVFIKNNQLYVISYRTEYDSKKIWQAIDTRNWRENEQDEEEDATLQVRKEWMHCWKGNKMVNGNDSMAGMHEYFMRPVFEDIIALFYGKYNDEKRDAPLPNFPTYEEVRKTGYGGRIEGYHKDITDSIDYCCRTYYASLKDDYIDEDFRKIAVDVVSFSKYNKDFANCLDSVRCQGFVDVPTIVDRRFVFMKGNQLCIVNAYPFFYPTTIMQDIWKWEDDNYGNEEAAVK